MFVDTTGGLWGVVSKLFIKAGNTKDIEYINKTSAIFSEISNKEKKSNEYFIKCMPGVSLVKKFYQKR